MKKYKQSKACELGKCPVTVTFESRCSSEVLEQIQETIGSRPAETGGILGTSDDGKTIDHFFFDEKASVSGVTYSPDTDTLNDVIEKWNDEGVMFCGFIHSHPRGCISPSGGDYFYAERILSCMKLPNDTMVMPIVQVICPKRRSIAVGYYEHKLEHKPAFPAQIPDIPLPDEAASPAEQKNFPESEKTDSPDCISLQEPTNQPETQNI